tara:strand:+ start:10340 stop:10699 length:360 start_codon:yes stop_codon:yes gene_type:complete
VLRPSLSPGHEPVQRLHRVCTQDYELGGTQIRAGDWVAIFHASANRDPDVFERPDNFILKRPNMIKQATFGHGIHHCMGAGIARNEAAQMINSLLNRYSRPLNYWKNSFGSKDIPSALV